MNKRSILLASTSENKLKELSTVAQEFDIEVFSPREAQVRYGLKPPPVVEENEPTYRGNALLKAKAYSLWANCTAVADDTGLEVAALDNRPGIFSARYAGEGASDQKKIEKLLTEFNAIRSQNPQVDPSAAFVCSLVMHSPSGSIQESYYRMPGRLLLEPRGNKGFGYDPVVYLDEIGSTLAEVDFSITCQIGFRAKAARLLFGNRSERDNIAMANKCILT